MASQAWLFSLLAAQKDWRLALLRLGHMHHVGDLEMTPDRDLSYAYYINIARQTSIDQKNPSPQQVRDFLSLFLKTALKFLKSRMMVKKKDRRKNYTLFLYLYLLYFSSYISVLYLLLHSLAKLLHWLAIQLLHSTNKFCVHSQNFCEGNNEKP